ncbi:bifunctional nicotinamidase/pyrazinamidase [Rhodothermus marinus]|uniref:bifunctional nicotinamidase/pyrazinamidase n=1 Tax=Rhodothermus marinus TaxID=29549 RepID=UPI0012BA38CC|nr:bifunctional nicotinamidase/pyrazinamidase [Rhodothermus marinus]BBM71985.1 nicotinamidase [Rhodothermus marinus]
MKALLVVDVQNDFCPGGALPVPEGDAVVPVINRLNSYFENIILTQDWHPAGHWSFASAHPGKKPFETIQLSYGEQVLWPDHCVQGTPGADFHPELDTTRAQLIIRKGFRKEIDSYSAFYENDKQTTTGLAGYLKERGITTLYVVGLAADFCVKWSALDGRRLGFDVYVVTDATRGIDTNGSLARAWEEMKAAGVHLITSDEVIRQTEPVA